MSNKRISILFSLLPQSKIIADVGCDHGYLVNKIAQSNIAEMVVGSEISKGSLEKAKSNFNYDLAKIPVEFILSDGLKLYDKIKPDCVVIAGMGGCEIIKILQDYEYKESIKTLVLQPMRNQDKLRLFLQKNYFIEKDFIVKIKDVFYTFILAVKGSDNLNEEEIIIGKSCFLHSPIDFKEYLDYNINNFKNYKENAQNLVNSQKLNEKINFLIKVKEKYYGKDA